MLRIESRLATIVPPREQGRVRAITNFSLAITLPGDNQLGPTLRFSEIDVPD